MKSKFARSLVLAAVVAGVLTVPVADSWAQETTDAVPITTIKIKNIRAEMMMSWLSPPKDPLPKPLEIKRKVFKGPVRVPDAIPGLQSITANAAKNELWVQGTPESVRMLKEIVSFLDSPVKQLELKTQVVEVDAAEVAGIGEIEDSGKVKLLNLATGQQTLVFKAEFQDKIKDLIASRKAKVLHASQTTVSNNSTARVSWDANLISERIALQLTPTIQYDKTITLFLSRTIGEGEIAEGRLFSQTSFLTTVANIRAGDTVVLRLNNFETVSSEGNERVTLLLTSGRIIED